jgi:prepilin-type N-terminal cleavage/methylation domain-containing protein/prepilin-type processing-associated H-X9-DG protein
MRQEVAVRYHRHQAFSLVEMLVVVAIIGVLMGILLPALGSIHETMRNAQCLNNLKSIGYAMHSYHESNKCFPINYGKLSGAPDCNSFSNQTGSAGTLGRSWLVGVLPYIDELDLFNTIRFDQALNWTDATQPVNSPLRTPNIYVAQTVIPVFRCSSDPVDNGQRTDRDIPGNWAVLNYNASSGSNLVYFEQADLLPNPLSTGYPHLANNGVQPTWLFFTSGRHAFEPNGIDCGNGIIHRGAFGPEPTSLDDIFDGLSNTIAVGEVIPSLHPKKWWYWWDGSTASAAMPINFRPVQPADGTGEPTMPVPAEWQRNCGFQSRHPGSCNFLMVDNSVRSFDETMDIYLFRNLANFAGGDGIIPAE